MEPTIIDLDTLERLEGWGGLKLVNEMIRLFLENGPTPRATSRLAP